MKKQIVTAFALTAVSVSLLVAQTRTPPTPAQLVTNLVARLTALLTLTTGQQTQATAIFTTEQTALSTLNTSLQTAHTALQTAVKNNDLTGIVTQSTQIGNLTTQQVEAQAKADAAFYAILTTDQKTKYDELHSVGVGGRSGPGNFGAPGPR